MLFNIGSGDQRRLGARLGGWCAILALTVNLSACVKRTIIIESEPSGADVFVNHDVTAIGQTPVEIPIHWYGAYRFRLVKNGYEELTAHELIRAPFYERLPVDLISEHLLPQELEDRHHFRYALTPYDDSPTARRLEEPDAARRTRLNADLNASNSAQKRRALMELAAHQDISMLGAIEQQLIDNDPIVRAIAIRTYRLTAGAEAAKRIVTMLQDSDARVRAQAAGELRVMAPPEAAPFLLLSLNDGDRSVRAAVIEALGAIGDPQAVEPINRSLRDRDSGVRRSAAEALGRLGDRRAVPALTKALRDRNLIVRRRAVMALRRLGDPSAVEALIRTLRDRDHQTRDTAALAVEELSDLSTMPALIDALDNRRAAVRLVAVKSLAKLEAQESLPALRQRLLRETSPLIKTELVSAIERAERRMESAP